MEEIKSVLIVSIPPMTGAHGQTVGANAGGEFAYVFVGKAPTAEDVAKIVVKDFGESALKYATTYIEAGELWSGPAIRVIDGYKK